MSYFEHSIVFNTKYSPEGAMALKSDLAELGEYTITWGKAAEEAAGMSARAFRNMLFGTQMALFYGSMLYTASMRQQTAALSLEEAQDRLNRAIRDYGVNSEQATSAARSLERQQLLVQRANILTTISTIGMGLQLVNVGVQIYSQLPILTQYVTTLWSMVAAQAALHPWMIPAIVGAVGVVGGLAGGFAISSQFNMKGMTENDLNEALAEHDRRARYEFRRAVG